jgi:subtilisin family serine protease
MALAATLVALPARSMAGGAVDGAVAAPRDASASSASASSASASSPSERAAALPAGHAWTVTLVTGDVVGVRTVSGRPPLVSVRPGPGRRGVIFSTFVDTRGHVRVLPQDVAPLVGSVLDPTLFDVTALIKNGDDDAHRSSVPLIVQGEAGASGTAASGALSASLRHGVILSSIDAVAVREPKAAAARVGRALAVMASAVARPGRAAARAGRIRYVWLDRTARVSGGALAAAAAARTATLDHNLVQIGAPAAWRAGDTGRGVKVAVLDTGVDATHPDLRGQIVAERNFSGSPGVADRFGHGTFVAAQIAGTGRAAGGGRRGVAFGARLVIGKVLGDDGTGLDSSVIAGMQWAATRARVISMSLGGLPSDGTDPVSQAVNRLTTADHVLFVVAAGNFGPADETVSSPAAASDALAVGAVDGRDRLAIFSSRGPRLGNYAIKPEIVAPGVDIVGARAAGTTMGSPLDARYVIDSGTSMATPQVAGAAAILAALHPRWSPARLAADLVCTAHPATGGDIYELGGGRLDIAAEVTASLTADQAVTGFGAVPDGLTRPVTRKLSWTNIGRHTTTVRLSAYLTTHAGQRAPAGALRLGHRRVHIPARRSATVSLSVSPRLLASHPGLYEGEVVARDGATIIRTPVSLYLPPPTHTLTLRATALPGTGPGGLAASADVLDITDPDLFQAAATFGTDGTATLQVPDGRYWVIGAVDDLTNPQLERSAMVGQPEVTVDHNTTVTLDGAAAVPVTASVTGHRTQVAAESVHLERSFDGQVAAADLYFFGPATTSPVLYAQPTGTAHTGSFRAYSAFRLISPAASAASYVYDLYHLLGTRIPASAAYQITPARQARLARVDQRFYALDGDTAPIDESRYGLTATGFLAIQNSASVPGGSTRTDYLSTQSGIAWDDEVAPPITLAGQTRSGPWVIEVPGFTRYRPGSRQTADWARQPFRPGPYSGQPSVSLCAPQATTRSRGDIHVELVDLQDLPDGFDCLGGLGGDSRWLAATSRIMRLYRDGHLIGARRTSVADFTVPPAAATYRLTYHDTTSSVLPVSTRTDTTWTFRSAALAGLGAVRIPLLLVGYELPLGLDDHAVGRAAVLTVAPIAGAPRARVSSLRMWTSTDNGRTWQKAPVRALGAGRYTAILPPAAAGQAVSLRVRATDTGGSEIDQTIMTAYHG